MKALGRKEWLWVSLVALGLAVVWTWPLAAHLGSGLPYNERFVSPAGSDNHIWVWDFWSVKQALAAGHSPFSTNMVLPPLENGLGLHTHVILYGLLALPFTAWLGAPTAVGVMLILLFASAWVAAWWMARRMGLSRIASAFVAIGWAFAPYFLQKSLDHMCYVASPWPPLAVGWLAIWMERGSTKAAVGTLLALVLSAYVGPLFGSQVALLALLVWCLRPPASVGSEPGPRPARARIFDSQRAVLVVALAALAVAPPAWAVWKEAQSSHAFTAHQTSRMELGATGFSVTAREMAVKPQLGSFFALPELSPFGAQDLVGLPGGNEISALHLSGALLVTAVLALILVRRRGLFRWGLVAAVFLLATWDPATPWGAPSDGYRQLPLLDGFRVTARWFPYGLLPLLILAGAGLDSLRATGSAGRVAAPVLVGLLVFESWPRALPMMSVEAPQEILDLGPAPDQQSFVLTLPSQFGAYQSMTWQTSHERGAVVSYLARPNPWSILALQETLPDLYQLLVPRFQADGLPSLPDPMALALDLSIVHVDVIVLEVAAFGSRQEIVNWLADYLDELNGWSRVNQDTGLWVWERTASSLGNAPQTAD